MKYLTVFLALAMLGLSLGKSQPPASGKRLAVLVGVKRYDNVNFGNLDFTENDVVELARVLRPQGFEVVLLSDSQGPSLLPTRGNILARLDAVLKKRVREDVVLFAFAGHGVQFLGDSASYFLPRDAEPNDSTTMISLKTVYDRLEDCGAGVKLMFVDACRSQVDKVRFRAAFDDRTPAPPKGVCALFSCSAGQTSMEMSDLKHGLFFFHLLEGLRGKASNAQGDVTVLRLAAHTTEEVDAAGLNQNPVLKGETTNGVLVRRARPVAPTAESVAGSPIENSIGMKLAYIPPGTFTMGSSPAEQGLHRKLAVSTFEPDRAAQEKQHAVTISRGFHMGVFPVTQAEYARVLGANPSHFSIHGAAKGAVAGLDTTRFPVEAVTWQDANAFCAELTKRERRKYRLPTEAEWEYACRAGTTTAFHVGDSLSTDQANYDGNYPFPGGVRGKSRERPLPVGSFPPNAWGLHDMHGNVAQWCADWYGEKEYDRGSCKDPRGPGTGLYRIVRGGGWSMQGRQCRSAYREYVDPNNRMSDVGFRVVLELER